MIILDSGVSHPSNNSKDHLFWELGTDIFVWIHIFANTQILWRRNRWHCSIAVSEQQINQCNLWKWLHIKGFWPNKKSFTARSNKKILICVQNYESIKLFWYLLANITHIIVFPQKASSIEGYWKYHKWWHINLPLDWELILFTSVFLPKPFVLWSVTS